jgi:hypothetical protein
VDRQAAVARLAHLLQRLLRGDVHHEQGTPRDLGERDGARRRLGLDLGGPRVGVKDRRELALRHVLADQHVDDVAVLGVDTEQGAGVAHAPHDAEQVRVGLHQRRALVGHEALEAADAVGHDVLDLVERVAAQIGQHHVEAVVDDRLAGGLLVPFLQGREEALARLLDGPVDDSGDAAGGGGGGAGAEIVGGVRCP